jgi:hypothetical protein
VLAIIAAVVFAIAFILELVGKHYNDFFNPTTLTTLGLLLLALHLAPTGKMRWRR